jgi:hybrid cluster-associated redox disulfide protein
MRRNDIADLSVAEIMTTWPSTVRVFLDYRMHCIGCPIAPFHALPDAAREHDLRLADLLVDIQSQIERERLTGTQVSDHPR